MATGKFTFVGSAATSGERRLRESAGQQWDTANAHYAVLVKAAHTPTSNNTTFSTLTNICNSANYAHKNLTGKAFLASNAIDCDDIDFTSAGANVMIARYLYVVEGTASSPGANDRVIGYVDLNDGGTLDVNVNAAIQLATVGLVTFTPV